jgi:hypothetical protein
MPSQWHMGRPGSQGYSALHLHFTSTQNANDVAESEYQNLLSRRLRLVGWLGFLREIVLPCPPTSGVERSGPPAIFTSTTLRRPLSTHAHNTQTQAILRRPPSSHTPRPGSDDSSHAFSHSKLRYLLVVEEEEEEEEMKSFTGCCHLEDLSRVCTPSHSSSQSRI